ncbi:hypothetical protein [Falsiphaeobacter marinintestinus]|uniref:hypothetical protein n=1 Tax=Falsiphaeobacter marinintestinus TaxID=1492905 RepID=UPI0011B56004|nr:hypothetical protein [Phaeobacter marinintestinus]
MTTNDFDTQTLAQMLTTLVGVSIGYGCQLQARADDATLAKIKQQTQDRMNEILLFAHSESLANEPH